MSGQGVTLVCNGTQFGPWERVDISRQMEALAGKFELNISDASPLAPCLPQFAPQTPCIVRIGGQNVISGFIDSAGPELTADGHIIKVKGRDATGDLVDCCFTTSGERRFQGMSFAQTVGVIVAPFKIRVLVDPSAAAAAALVFVEPEMPQPTEKAAQLIDRLSRLAGVLAIADGNGGLIITRAGSAPANTRLAVGENCERVEFTRDDSGRFSQYLVLNQGVQVFLTQASIASPWQSATAYDAGVKRFRPMLIIMETETSFPPADLARRAVWEASVRYGRAFRGVYSVPSWTDAAGALWSLNAMVQVVDPVALVNEELLISGVQFQLDDGLGTRALLTVTRREAYLTSPLTILPVFQSGATPSLALPPGIGTSPPGEAPGP